jgi:PAS domain S-box-containing protein
MAGNSVSGNTAAAIDSTTPGDLDLVAAYQHQICELELSITELRGQAHTLKANIEELSELQVHYQQLFNYAPTGYVLHDRTGKIRDINWAGARMFGLGKDERAYPGSVMQFVVREDIPVWMEHMRTCTQNRRATSELSISSREGRLRPIYLISEMDVQSGRRGGPLFRTILMDITQRRVAEAALAQTQLDYHQLIDTMEGIVWEANANTLQFTFVSRYAEKLLGYPVAEWSRPGFWYDRIYAADREQVANHVARAVANRQELLIEYRVRAADRRVVWLHDNVTTRQRNGQLRLLGVAIDVSERRKAEESLRQARDSLEQRVAERTTKLRETVADLEAFSYSLSHDMRSPLRAMQGYASLLEGLLGEKLGPEPLQFTRRIMRSAERLDALVQDVLNYGRIARAPLELKPLSLSNLVENILDDYPTLAKARSQIEIQQPLLPVCGHEAFAGQALSNLLTNAVKFVPLGRVPRVRLWTEETHRKGEAPQVDGAEGDKWVRIWVEDNGIGIGPEDQRRVFQIFERVHSAERYEGTGIGLAIVQKAVERMGGRVGVQSSLGHGTKFWIELRGISSVESVDVP